MQLAVGLPLGMVGAFLKSRLLMQMLFQITTTDVTTFAGIPALLIVTVVGASLLPAIRAARLNPVDALRV
jgi:ABC-type antimicrobial peptide transport system permease subunit